MKSIARYCWVRIETCELHIAAAENGSYSEVGFCGLSSKGRTMVGKLSGMQRDKGLKD